MMHRISDAEKAFKLCRVKRQELTGKKIPYIVTHDGRTIRYALVIMDLVGFGMERFVLSSTLFVLWDHTPCITQFIAHHTPYTAIHHHKSHTMSIDTPTLPSRWTTW
ncbi:hypothetical protein EON63_03495 [archaeon]|nr:MAG: hypothetical protein EON63_03495 [archaeon]